MTTQEQVDPQKVEAFAGRMLDLINGTAVTFMLSIGNQTGLFDRMAEMPPSTSEEIAAAAGLNERYVREWLAALVVGRIIEYDPANKTYRLPPEHAASLTHAAGTGNLAGQTEYFPMLGEVEQEIIRSFKQGGGVPYERFSRFHEIMRQESAATFSASLIEKTLPLVPGLIEKLEQGIDVADVGCGAGYAVNLMGKHFPNSRFVGYDISEQAIGMAKKEAAELGLTNVEFEVRDAAALGIDQRFDFVATFDAIHDQAQPGLALDGIYKALKPGGVYLCCDIAASSNLEENMDHILGPLLYTVSTMHCMTVSLAYDGIGLGTMWGEQMAHKMIREAGFPSVETHNVEDDIFNNYYLAVK